MYETKTVVGSLTAAWICAETSTWPPALVNGGLVIDAGDEDRLGAERELARRALGDLGRPSAVAVTVKLAGNERGCRTRSGSG